MASKLVEDLSTLTTISKLSLDTLVTKCNTIICHDVEESILDQQQITEVDIGIGTLYIQIVGEQVKYKFIPSDKLNAAICKTVKTGASPLVMEVEGALKSRVERAYKDLF